MARYLYIGERYIAERFSSCFLIISERSLLFETFLEVK